MVRRGAVRRRVTRRCRSEYGILSLAKNDSYFGAGENYWRGPIWINMNYLLLASLHNNYLPAAASDEHSE